VQAQWVSALTEEWRWQRVEDNSTMSQLVQERDEYKKTLGTEKADNDFLLDLKSHLPAEAELETLLKAKGIHPADTGIGLTGGISDYASITCCAEEIRRFRRYTSASDLFRNQQALTSGQWLRLRCPDYLK
jgi:hypothetical protein